MSDPGQLVMAEGGMSVSPAPGDAGDDKPKAIVGRSPGQLAWLRLRRDRVAFSSALVLAFFFLVAIFADVLSWLYGKGPNEPFTDKLDGIGYPLGYYGISGEHWFGLEPRLGRDTLMLLIFGLRTSLLIAVLGAILAVALGVLVGVLAGFLGGWVDQVITWFMDFMLAFPFFIFALAIVPVIQGQLVGLNNEVPAEIRVVLILAVFVLFSWVPTARVVRGQVLSLREREFVEAARAAGAGTAHIVFRQVLPNLWAPILVVFSLLVPGLVTAEAALSFLGIGVVEPTPDLGRMIFDSVSYMQTDWVYMIIPGTTIFLLVLTFNLFGDSLRDALDPKSSR